MSENKFFNKQLYSYLYNKENTIAKKINTYTDNLINNILTEYYVTKEMSKSMLTCTKNWWLCNNNYNTTYAIHFDDCEPKYIDKAFGEKLAKECGYKVFFVYVEPLTSSVKIIGKSEDGNTITYSMEEFIKAENLQEKELYKESIEKSIEERPNITQEIANWFYKNIVSSEFVIETFVFDALLDKYFKYKMNLDIVWSKIIENKPHFFIGEIKYKSTYGVKGFLLNYGEKVKYEEITNKSNITVVALLLKTIWSDRAKYLERILKNEQLPIFYHAFTGEEFKNAIASNGHSSELDRRNNVDRKKNSSTVMFPFEMFVRVSDFNKIDTAALEKEKTLVTRTNETLNNMICKNGTLFLNNNNEKNSTFIETRVARLMMFNRLENAGYNINCDEMISANNVANDIVNINGHKVLIKYMQQLGWNLMIHQSAWERVKNEKVEYILVIKKNYNDKYSKDLFYSIDKETNLPFFAGNKNVDYMNILGFMSIENFATRKNLLPKEYNCCQKNFSSIEKGYAPTYMDKPMGENTYFLRITSDSNAPLNGLESIGDNNCPFLEKY